MIETYDHHGCSYVELLTRFHSFLKPKSYLEIGTLNGGTLALSSCASIAIDPQFKLDISATADRPATLFFQLTSDDFFGSYDPSVLFGRPIDFAFLDGLHHSEALLRDFINTEKHCRPNSVIAMHDCIPGDTAMTVRADTGGMWTGDVWKIVPILREHRPDLKIYCFDGGPTGLVCITGLNPQSRQLEDNYFSIVERWQDVDLNGYGYEKMIEDMKIRSTETVSTFEDMARYFWL